MAESVPTSDAPDAPDASASPVERPGREGSALAQRPAGGPSTGRCRARDGHVRRPYRDSPGPGFPRWASRVLRSRPASCSRPHGRDDPRDRDGTQPVPTARRLRTGRRGARRGTRALRSPGLVRRAGDLPPRPAAARGPARGAAVGTRTLAISGFGSRAATNRAPRSPAPNVGRATSANRTAVGGGAPPPRPTASLGRRHPRLRHGDSLHGLRRSPGRGAAPRPRRERAPARPPAARIAPPLAHGRRAVPRVRSRQHRARVCPVGVGHPPPHRLGARRRTRRGSRSTGSRSADTRRPWFRSIEPDLDCVIAGIPVADFPTLIPRAQPAPRPPAVDRARDPRRERRGRPPRRLTPCDGIEGPARPPLHLRGARRPARAAGPSPAALVALADSRASSGSPGNHVGYLWSPAVRRYLMESLAGSGLGEPHVTMSAPEPLSGMDARFIYSETEHAHMQTLKIAVLDFDAAGPRSTPRASRPNSTGACGPCRRCLRRVVTVPFGMGHPVWVDDPEFSIERHFAIRAIDPPGDAAALARVVGEIASTPLPRDRPLWSATLVTGLADAEVAVVAKVHHSVADGARDRRDAAPGPRRRADGPTRAGSTVAPTAVLPPRDGTGPHRRARPAEQAPHASPGGRRVGTEHGDDRLAPLAGADPCCQAVRRSPHVVQRLALRRADLRDDDASPRRSCSRCDRALDGTLNDAYLAICAGALREYFLARGESVDRPLIASVPIGIRGDDPGRISGNRVDNMYVRIPVELADPVMRFRAVHEDVAAARALRDLMDPALVARRAELTPTHLYPLALRALGRVEARESAPPSDQSRHLERRPDPATSFASVAPPWMRSSRWARSWRASGST